MPRAKTRECFEEGEEQKKRSISKNMIDVAIQLQSRWHAAGGSLGVAPPAGLPRPQLHLLSYFQSSPCSSYFSQVVFLVAESFIFRFALAMATRLSALCFLTL